tara:strand:+ start:1517 stop:1759 length:243 start_codon:yes stop_codon:yes gene_type:complete
MGIKYDEKVGSKVVFGLEPDSTFIFLQNTGTSLHRFHVELDDEMRAGIRIALDKAYNRGLLEGGDRAREAVRQALGASRG